jgi:hypothetical protein
LRLRQAERIEYGVEELVAQRVYGLALGYEDLNDHEELRRDPLLGVLAGKADPTGASRARQRDQGKVLAGNTKGYNPNTTLVTSCTQGLAGGGSPLPYD